MAVIPGVMVATIFVILGNFRVNFSLTLISLIGFNLISYNVPLSQVLHAKLGAPFSVKILQFSAPCAFTLDNAPRFIFNSSYLKISLLIEKSREKMSIADWEFVRNVGLLRVMVGVIEETNTSFPAVVFVWSMTSLFVRLVAA